MSAFAKIVERWNGFSVEWHDGDEVVLARRRHLYRAAISDPTPRCVASVPVSLSRRLVSRVRLGQRALRAMFYNVVPIDHHEWFVTYDRAVGVLSEDGWFELAMQQRARVMRGGVAHSPDGAIWFGEYFDNKDRDPVHVYRWQRGEQTLRLIHTFPQGEVYHVHSLTWDPWRQGLICCVGDRGAECRMLLTRDEFRTIDVIGEGNEDWRAVSVVPTPDGWLFGTDAEFQQNRIIHVDADTKLRRVVGNVEGPVYFSRAWGACALFTVTAERCEIMPRPEAVLWSVSDGQAEPIIRFGKDLGDARWVWRVFLPGTLNFALGPGDEDQLFISGVALQGLDSQVLSLRRV